MGGKTNGGVAESKFLSGLVVLTGIGPDPLDEIRRFRPDLVHIHNLFPNWGTSWLSRLEVPAVMTLHNHRWFCARGDFYRANSFCNDCVLRGMQSAVIHRCYRSSAMATIPLAVGLAAQRTQVFRSMSKILALSEMSRQIIESHAPQIARKLLTLPNFSPLERSLAIGEKESSPWLFVGRLTEEKGVLDLVKGWRPSYGNLSLLGDGPLRGRLGQFQESGLIKVLPRRDRAGVAKIIEQSRGLIFPSRSSESSPIVVLDALAVGVPVISRNGGPLTYKICQAGAGVGFSSMSRLGEALGMVRDRYSDMALRAEQLHRREFSEEVWISRTERIYSSVLKAPQGP